MTGQRFHYRISGLVVESDFPLDEAVPCRAERAEVRIVRSRIPAVPDAEPAFRKYRLTPTGDLLEYEGVGRFLVAGGSRIDCDPEEGFDLRRLGIPLLGPVFALLLHRRGHFILHGSAVEIRGEAHVFLGDKGAGKSTIAAVLVAAGHRLIADDVVALERTRSGLCIRPGYPAMKIERDMLERFAADDYRIIEPDDGGYTAGKSRIRLLHRVPHSAIPLGPVHRLDRGRGNELTPLDRHAALQTLIRFSYYPRFGEAALARRETSALFAAAAELAHLAKVDRLTVKDCLGEIAAIAPFLAREHALSCLPG